MPIDNCLIGAWKKISFPDANNTPRMWILENFTETVSQDISVKQFVHGTPRSNILDIGGAIAEIKVVSPLLISNNRRLKFEDINDGMALWYNFIRPSMLWNYQWVDPGQLLQSAKFSVSSDSYAKYELNFITDIDSLHSENNAENNYMINSYEDDIGEVIESGNIYRVAQFFDVNAEISAYEKESGEIVDRSISGYLTNLNINLNVDNSSFNFIGQKTQRKVIGATGIEVIFDGTIISEEREFKGYNFPWQAMKLMNDNLTTTGGTAKSSINGLRIWLRRPYESNLDETEEDPPEPIYGLNIIPNVVLKEERSIGQSSSINIGSGFISTTFNGRMWMTAGHPFIQEGIIEEDESEDISEEDD